MILDRLARAGLYLSPSHIARRSNALVPSAPARSASSECELSTSQWDDATGLLARLDLSASSLSAVESLCDSHSTLAGDSTAERSSLPPESPTPRSPFEGLERATSGSGPTRDEDRSTARRGPHQNQPR